MGQSGTIGVADLYGRPSRTSSASDPLGITNANSNGVTTPMTQAASGGGGAATGGVGPAVAWVGLVAAVITLRLFVHLADAA